MVNTGAIFAEKLPGYWIVSGPRVIGGKPLWPNKWHAQFLPSGGGIYDAWAATEKEAREGAIKAAVDSVLKPKGIL
jgi:hypothetical protein